jgi:predicted acetyltransferase
LSRLELRAPDPALERTFMAMVDEFRAAGEHRFVDEDVLVRHGFAAYLDWLARGARGELEGLAPWQALWAVADGRLLGVVSLRHPLTPWMTEFGGHIGYRVRPTERRRGIGTRVLALALARLAALGVAEAIVVCEPDNDGSIGVLRANGARFDRELVADGLCLNRYRVPTSAPGR